MSITLLLGRGRSLNRFPISGAVIAGSQTGKRKYWATFGISSPERAGGVVSARQRLERCTVERYFWVQRRAVELRRLVEEFTGSVQVLSEQRFGRQEAEAEEMRKRPDWRVDKVWTCSCGRKCMSAFLPAQCMGCGEMRYEVREEASR
jgi:hypothetical protein